MLLTWKTLEITSDCVSTLVYFLEALYLSGEIPVFLRCPDVDPMHSPKIAYSPAVSSLYPNYLAS